MLFRSSLHVKLLSFQTLYITLLTLIALSPQLFFHIGFWFSICGVFYNFLYLHWFEKSFNKVVHVLFLNIYVFLCINPIVHFFFPTTSFLQLLCIPLSVVFVVFYPVMMALHVVGFGGIFDGYLYEFLSFKASEWEYFTPFWLLCTYLILSLVAIRFKVVAVILIFFGIIPFCVG